MWSLKLYKKWRNTIKSTGPLTFQIQPITFYSIFIVPPPPRAFNNDTKTFAVKDRFLNLLSSYLNSYLKIPNCIAILKSIFFYFETTIFCGIYVSNPVFSLANTRVFWQFVVFSADQNQSSFQGKKRSKEGQNNFEQLLWISSLERFLFYPKMWNLFLWYITAK